MRLMDCNETLRKVEQIPFIENENKAFHEGCRYMQKKVLRILHKSKSVDAEPIVHAHWVYNNDDETCCSECGHRANLSSFEYFARDKIRFDDSLYCHFCGACMDEVIE